MIFQCKNCGGNVIYSPSRGKMFCPHCDSEESQEEQQKEQGTSVCTNCGGSLQVGDMVAASQCPYCNSYLIFDERIQGEYTPHLILPFKMDKNTVKKMLQDKFKKSVFAPSDFFSDGKLESMEGMYVPFWMYDYTANGHYDGEGVKVRTWVTGNRRFTEKSYYHVVREMEVSFDKVPVDASEGMPDYTMDLMEPYDYKALENFKAEYLSGFAAERYNQVMEELEPRARKKVEADVSAMLQNSVTGYASKMANSSTVDLQRTEENYSLLPVWVYHYTYKGHDYPFYVNGQNGKMVGTVPIVPEKVFGYSATVFGLIFAGMILLRSLLFLL